LEAYKEYVNEFKLTDDPEIFGMHRNAVMTYQAQETDKLLKTTIAINPTASAVGGTESSNKAILDYCEFLLDAETGIPALIKLEEIHESHTILDAVRKLRPSLSTVMLQEVDRFNKLLVIIVDSLEKLAQAVNGTIIMSAVLDNIFFCLLNNQVPNLWANNAYPSLKPLSSWVRNLRLRVEFFRTWLRAVSPNEYQMPYFFFPQGFLTAVLQTYSRNNRVAIDKLKFEFRVVDVDKENTKTDTPIEPGAVYISGLYLEGSRWDKKRRSLLDQYDGVMYDEMPPITFIPVEIKELTARELKRMPKQVPSYQ
jgi:dynein heavy chain, axonemal